MEDIKIKKTVTYKYYTSDDEEFDDEIEAKEWQAHLNAMKQITMLNEKFKAVTTPEYAYYVHIKTDDDVKSFSALQDYYGLSGEITKPGYYRYDDDEDVYVDIEAEIQSLINIINQLNNRDNNTVNK